MRSGPGLFIIGARPTDDPQKMADIPRSTLATLTVLRGLIFELDRKGVISGDEFIMRVQAMAIAQRNIGDPQQTADSLNVIADYLMQTLDRLPGDAPPEQ